MNNQKTNEAVYGAVRGDVAVGGAVDEDSPHPALQDFLLSVRVFQ